MPKEQAQQQTIANAIEKLRTVNISRRCVNVGLPQPVSNRVSLRAFGRDWELGVTEGDLRSPTNGQTAKADMQILVLHYLLCENQVRETNDLISFREFPGGKFYFGPFQSRGTNILVKRIGNDLKRLRANLDRFDWQPVDKGDVGARIHCIGPLHVTLIYNAGDDEFGPDADLLFDKGFVKAFSAEDAAVVGQLISLALC